MPDTIELSHYPMTAAWPEVLGLKEGDSIGARTYVVFEGWEFCAVSNVALAEPDCRLSDLITAPDEQFSTQLWMHLQPV